MSGGDVLEGRGLTLAIDGAVLVDEADLSLRAGEVLAVVGPNGAGKSTLLRLLSGELEPTAGRVILDGRPLHAYRHAELARRRAVLPQHTLLQFAFRTLDVVLMGRYPHRDSTPEHDREVALRVMADTDTLHLTGRTYTTLSGGEQTRVALARVLAQETPIVMLDEPTGSLDLRHQEMVMGTLHGLAGEGVAVLAVLHDLNLAARYADRVALMSGGRIRAVAPTGDVMEAGLLSEVYGHPVGVVPHPHFDCPFVFPLPNGAAARCTPAAGADR
jgi:iron complex transport system ATP-binding protein